MDHSGTTQLIGGQYEQIFSVRDLASHRQLAWRGVPSTDAAEACEILEELFAHYGPPLVIKSDNGSAFIADHAWMPITLENGMSQDSCTTVVCRFARRDCRKQRTAG
jgi:hypothetical protein